MKTKGNNDTKRPTHKETNTQTDINIASLCRAHAKQGNCHYCTKKKTNTLRHGDTKAERHRKRPKNRQRHKETPNLYGLFFYCLHPNPFRKEMKKVNKQIKGSYLDEEFYGTRGGN